MCVLVVFYCISIICGFNRIWYFSFLLGFQIIRVVIFMDIYRYAFFFDLEINIYQESKEDGVGIYLFFGIIFLMFRKVGRVRLGQRSWTFLGSFEVEGECGIRAELGFWVLGFQDLDLDGFFSFYKSLDMQDRRFYLRVRFFFKFICEAMVGNSVQVFLQERGFMDVVFGGLQMLRVLVLVEEDVLELKISYKYMM